MGTNHKSRLPTVALLAGAGQLPELVARRLADRHDRVVGCIIADCSDSRVIGYLDESRQFLPTQFESLLNYLSESSVDALVMCGKIERSLLFDDESINNADETVQTVLENMDDHGDGSLIALAGEMIRDLGINILEIGDVLDDQFTPDGHIAGPEPSTSNLRTLEFLGDRATMIADAEIGQSIAGKRQSVVAVEAAEGTTNMIQRAGELAGTGCVVLKVARPDQDFRYDVPVIGAETLEALVEINASLLAAEAGKTLWVQRDRCRRLAEQNELSFIGWTQYGTGKDG